MKEHLKLSTVSTPMGWIESQQNFDRINSGKTSRQSENEGISHLDANETAESADVYETPGHGILDFDEADIESMNFETVLEHLDFIREQSMSAEGRQSMSQAHRPISPQQVTQMLS
jgi:hypothetical protein